MRYLSFIFILTVLTAQSTLDATFQDANALMQQERYEESAAKYERILSQGFEHADLYYNLGNAYYRSGQNGLAIWAYEKARQLNPRDDDISYNLSIAQTQVRDRIDMPETLFVVEWYRWLKSGFTLKQWIWIGLGGFLLSAFLFNLGSFLHLTVLRNQIVLAVVFIALISHMIALDKYWEFSDTREAIITDMEIFAYSAPFERSDDILFKIHEGVKVEIIQSQPEWSEIILLDGKKGWIRSDTYRNL
ncbi:MAG: tetratricopeptide repeat protein [Fidelibacterota bacterium]